jgi:hypothetical protein
MQEKGKQQEVEWKGMGEGGSMSIDNWIVTRRLGALWVELQKEGQKL